MFRRPVVEAPDRWLTLPTGGMRLPYVLGSFFPYCAGPRAGARLGPRAWEPCQRQQQLSHAAAVHAFEISELLTDEARTF
jgi:hypothetical protein